MTIRLSAILFCALISAWAMSAAAQTFRQRGFKPIDPLVEDVDPLAKSLRRHAPEMQVDGGGRQRLFMRRLPGDPLTGQPPREKILIIDRGVIAEFDRADYARDPQGRILTLIPPNTVFHIGLPKAEPEVKKPDLPPPPQMIDGRIRAEVDPTPTQSRLMARNENRPIQRFSVDKRRARVEIKLRRQRLAAVLEAIDENLLDESVEAE